MDEHLLKFWQSLNHLGINYIMVGGVAVNLHGYSRVTKDIDVWIEDTKENRKRLGLALGQFGYDDINLEDFQFVPGWTNFNIGTGIVLDILVEMAGLEDLSFEQCLEYASVAEIEDVRVPFLHINQLIANKKAVNRSRDQIDVIELEKIKQLRKEMGLD
ncbi:MAG: hypothetical protein ABIN67_19090 [Ferruginibacter sp.]